MATSKHQGRYRRSTTTRDAGDRHRVEYAEGRAPEREFAPIKPPAKSSSGVMRMAERTWDKLTPAGKALAVVGVIGLPLAFLMGRSYGSSA